MYCCRFVASNLVLEYTLSVAVCARAATAYGATLVGLQPGDALVDVGPKHLDFFAVILTAALALLLSLGTKEGATFNTGKLLTFCPAHKHHRASAMSACLQLWFVPQPARRECNE